MMYLHVREPVNSITHLFGAMLSMAGLIFLLFRSSEAGSRTHLFSALVFGLSLLFLYSSSSIYHWVVSSTEVIRTLRKIDHCMIFVY
ncbi:MAG: hypothetical protein AWM53_00056 [Candidatus Dichloromethanomonas elyunquensis]|nr:MAG: hypothetical protein AWM53_00056 [Candidatus Dichloromethanomonas elyunquensis]